MTGDDLDTLLAEMQTDMDAALEDDEALAAFTSMRKADEGARQADAADRQKFFGEMSAAVQGLSQQVSQLTALMATLQKFVSGNASHVGNQLATLQRTVANMDATMAAPKEIIRNEDGRPVGVRPQRGPI